MIGNKLSRINVITIFDNVNFGTYLQVIALFKKIEEFNSNVHIIDYNRQNQSILQFIKNQFKKNGLIKGTISCILNVPIEIYAFYKLKGSAKTYLSTTKKYSSFKDLQKDPPKGDVFITGSDQVWNSSYNDGIDRAYFLDFIGPENRKYSYAASLGQEKINDTEKKQFKLLLSTFNEISVREQSAKNEIEKLGYKNIKTVVDPTLLLNLDQWKTIIKRSNFVKKEKYVLLYSVENKKENAIILKYAKEIAQKYKLKIYSLSPRGQRSDIGKCDKNFRFCTLSEFIDLFYNSDFTIVSSFHGTAFSINFQKQFLSITPNKFNTRITNLVAQFNLSNRLIQQSEFNPNIINTLQPIDYTTIEEQLNALRQKDSKFIKNLVIQDSSNCVK